MATTGSSHVNDEAQGLLSAESSESDYQSFTNIADDAPKWTDLFDYKNDLIELKKIILSSPINILLLGMPFCFWSYYGGWSDEWIFFINFFTIIPLASVLGDATECLSEHLGHTVGGLLNATFSNAVEMIVMILAIKKAYYYHHHDNHDGETTMLYIVQMSLFGSIYSNSLLVLGCVFIANAVKYGPSTFNTRNVSANVNLLIIAGFVMILPAPYEAFYKSDEYMVSRAAAIILMIMYCFSVVYILYQPIQQSQSRSQSQSQSPQIQEEDENNENLDGEIMTYDININVRDINDENNEDEVTLSCIGSLLLLGITTLFVSIFCDYLVDAMEAMLEVLNLSEAWLGVILLPIMSNAVEHITAVRVAYKNKMEIALSIVIGSAAQIAMFIVPLAIIIAWILNLNLGLDWETFEVYIFICSNLIVYAIVNNGKTNWLEGVVLLSFYLLIAIAVWDQHLG